MLSAFVDSTPRLLDAWHVAHPRVPHPSTFKIHQKNAPDDPELHCDFIFAGEELRERIEAVSVDRETQASDHQPVLLTLA